MRKSNPPQFEIRKARDGWRWVIRRSGRIIMESGEAYRNLDDAVAPLLALTLHADSLTEQIEVEMERVR